MKDAQAHQHLDMAYAYVDAGQFEDALQECDRAIEMVPEWAEAHNLRGVILDEVGQLEEAISAYEEAMRLDAGFEEAIENLAEARAERKRRRARPKWRVAAFVVPFGVLLVTIGIVGVLEARRGPNWRLELDEYIAQSALPSEAVTVQSVAQAREPWNFSGEMGTAQRYDWPWGSVTPSFPPEAVQCVLLQRSRQSTAGDEEESVRQVVYVAYHSDGLYQVGWLAYAGPEEPFAYEVTTHLATIGCDLGVE